VSPLASASPWDPCYVREDGWVVHRYGLATGNTLRFAARDIRKERTGVHANIGISVNWISLAWSNFNIERDEDRVRLANSAYKHLDPQSNALDIAEFPQNAMKHALDLFCYGLWDEEVAVNVGGWMAGDANRTPAKRLLGDYVLADAGTILHAPPGMGKSYTALAWAVSQANGVEKIWRVYDAALPLYINLERSAGSMAGRLARVNVALGLPAETPLPFLNARGRTLSDVYEAAKKTVEQERVTVCYLDSISRAGAGSMNADDVANRIMDMLNALTPTWVAVAHSPRADDSHVFGSQMFDGAADLVIQLRAQPSRDKQATGISLQGTKANDLPKAPMSIHVYEWAADGLRSIRRGAPGEFAELDANQRRSLEEEISLLIQYQGPMTGTQIADALGRNRSNIAAFLAGNNTFEPERRGREMLYRFKTGGF
jgi:hypothetical protein